MNIVSLGYSITIFWVVLHILYRCFTSRTKARNILPTVSSPRNRGHRWLSASHWSLAISPAYLKLQTTGLNKIHDSWASFFKQTSHTALGRVFTIFYDLGSVAGALGMVTAIALLSITVYRSLLLTLSQRAFTSDSVALPGARPLYKRTPELEQVLAPDVRAERSTVLLQLILPGVTVPLSHLPSLLAALFCSQVIHELGHAIAAALESVPLSSVGVSLSVIIPSAFVSMPTRSIQVLRPRSKLRIISAGAFHNLILWALLSLFSYLRIGHLVWTIVGYQDVSHYGRVVSSVSQLSPLIEYLPINAVITELDDQSLASVDTSLDLWTSYLSGPKPKHDLGWCVDSRWFLDYSSEDCCGMHSDSSPSQVACFAADDALQNRIQQRCVPPLSVLQPDSSSSKRCKESAHCASHNTCIRLVEEMSLLRIKFYPPSTRGYGLETHDTSAKQQIQTVIWSGPRQELLEDVTVTRYRPRFWPLPLSLPHIVALFFDYIYTLTLSLYFFNLLPLPFIDGSAFLQAFLDFVNEQYGSQTRDASDLESGIGDALSSHFRTGHWGARITKSIQILTISLLIASLSLSLYSAIS